MLASLKSYQSSDIAPERMRMIRFYKQYGEEATKEAFGADRKVISRWQKRLRESGGKLTALIPGSTRPKHVRRPESLPRIVEFIKSQRELHYRIGKTKIKVFLDKDCIREGIATVSVSTIGNIIKRQHFFFQKQRRIYHDPSSKWAEGKRVKRLRVKDAPKPREFGYIVSDAVERITDGIKEFFISAVDVKMKFALTINYKRLTAENMLDFYLRFRKVYPGTIKQWQSDNGSENLGEFDQRLKADGIPHYFIYPRCPKIDAHIERYNRTIQDEFIDPNLELIHDKPLFHQKLADYLIYYNTKRPHDTLYPLSPLEYFVSKGGMSHMSLTYTLTR